jgi:hypothetical protein
VLYIERRPFDEPTENVFSQIEPQKLSKTQQNPNPATTQHNGFVNSGADHRIVCARAHNRSQLSKIQSSLPPALDTLGKHPPHGLAPHGQRSLSLANQPQASTPTHLSSPHTSQPLSQQRVSCLPMAFCGLWRRPHFAAPARAHTQTKSLSSWALVFWPPALPQEHPLSARQSLYP